MANLIISDEEKEIYKKLAKFLDSLPAGFPETESGVEFRILKRLFNIQEAKIAVILTMLPEPVESIFKRANISEIGLNSENSQNELANILENMALKGLIFRAVKNGQNLYSAAQFVIGIWEYHVNDLDTDFIKDANEYIPHFMHKGWKTQKTKQLRVVPISKSINAGMKVMPYEIAEEIIKKQSKIVVAPCICRKESKIMGHPCGKLEEACLVFGGGAFYYEQNKLGRNISQQEALDILHKGVEQGLVLQPGNSQKPMNICLCCGCCCQVLKNLNTLDEPAKAIVSNYFAKVDEEACIACGSCADICQMKAIKVDDKAEINLSRCIGCGLCVSVCTVDAISMEQKVGEEKYIPPANVVETYMKMAYERMAQNK